MKKKEKYPILAEFRIVPTDPITPIARDTISRFLHEVDAVLQASRCGKYTFQQPPRIHRLRITW